MAMLSPGDTVAGVRVTSMLRPRSEVAEAVQVTPPGTGAAALTGTVASRSHEQITRHWLSAKDGRFRVFGSPPSSGFAAR
jgi:hypothetical protein